MTSVFVFYGRFAAAYGTCWLLTVLMAVVTQSQIDTGAFGLVGFPLIALIYAVIRTGVRGVPVSAEARRGFEVIAANRAGLVSDETAEDILDRQLGHPSLKMFVVKGVDRGTHFDKTLLIRAESKEGAGVKAELEGVNVTEVYEQ
jgi:hypothetical protein